MVPPDIAPVESPKARGKLMANAGANVATELRDGPVEVLSVSVRDLSGPDRAAADMVRI